jgi:hypothetical protein
MREEINESIVDAIFTQFLVVAFSCKKRISGQPKLTDKAGCDKYYIDQVPAPADSFRLNGVFFPIAVCNDERHRRQCEYENRCHGQPDRNS